MKLILLAATAMLAVPAIAQQTTSPAGGAGAMPPANSTPTTADPQQTGDPATMPAPAAPAADGSTPMAQPGMSQPGTTAQTMPAPAADGTTPMGGYQPSQPALNGTATPGVAPTFQAAPSPSEAYPAPAPLASYPVCKAGQYDKCIQRSDAGGTRRSGKHRRR